MNPYTLEEKREAKRRKKAYENHPCKGCDYARWQQEYKVSCLFAKCVADDPILGNVHKRKK